MYTLTAQDRHGVLIRNATSQGYLVAHPGDGIDLENPNSNTRRGRVQPQSCQTLNTSDTKGVLTQDYRIRKLTPKECWRLQGWKDEDFEKAAKVCSDSQLYKQAGNGVTVPVIYEIAKRL
nr:MAG TPA: Cytosine specific methyltransferase [Caudoviricetes sp.]